MIKVTVLYIGLAIKIVEKSKNCGIECNSTLENLLNILAKKYEQTFELKVYSSSEKKLLNNIIILKKGIHTKTLNDVINDSEYIVLLSSIAGG